MENTKITSFCLDLMWDGSGKAEEGDGYLITIWWKHRHTHRTELLLKLDIYWWKVHGHFMWP